jgi:hypothetical protein
MKNNQKINHHSLVVNGLVMSSILLSVTLCVCVIISFLNIQSLRLATNQKQWKAQEPAAYYMQVVESRPDGGRWRWAAYVQESRPVTVTLLKTGDPNSKSWLDPTNMTIEQIFDLTERSCANRGVIDCGLEFDPKFHYPKQAESYHLIIIQIEQFIPCQSVANCFIEPELLP